MRLCFSRLGLFVTLLALTCQLALGASVPGTADSLAPFGIICHADGPGGAPASPLHRGPTCQFCPLCAAFTTPAPTLLSGSSIPVRAPAHLVRATPPLLAVVAPTTNLLSARPRGPPAEA